MSGNKLFGIDIAGLIHANISPGLLDATLHHTTPGTRTPGDPTAGINSTSVDYPCKGIADDYRDAEVDGTIVQMNDRKILLTGNSISGGAVVPEQTDGITIEGVRYTIINIKRDPAAATYLCQSRKA